jgi:hypothetical protein
MKSSWARALLCLSLILGLNGVCVANPGLSATKKPTAKHTRRPESRAPHADTEKNRLHAMVRMPHAPPNGWRRAGEEVSGGTGF